MRMRLLVTIVVGERNRALYRSVDELDCRQVFSNKIFEREALEKTSCGRLESSTDNHGRVGRHLIRSHWTACGSFHANQWTNGMNPMDEQNGLWAWWTRCARAMTRADIFERYHKTLIGTVFFYSHSQSCLTVDKRWAALITSASSCVQIK